MLSTGIGLKQSFFQFHGITLNLSSVSICAHNVMFFFCAYMTVEIISLTAQSCLCAPGIINDYKCLH